ncbi:unnamed protein product [Rotaria sp. Silwood2]|nr:unnamed protein product [Rotaria sp. Silwood2]CAF2540413.1 unnamed protein product [Rotaria sp. Silwood2]CAF3861890.1 unnamed protein product [Rotaria sp. Silwood2]CAF4027555.1 unnamed protein product [Rotaria sp. Silwood2]
MNLSSLWQILYIIFIYQLSIGLTLTSSSFGTNFTNWSEDDWLETRFLMSTKFLFNQQRYEHIILRTRMNEWSVELSYGNKSNLNKLWTELHLFLDHRHHSTSLNNSISGHIRHICRPPVISPITNDSNTRVPELSDIDRRIAEYFLNDGFFRTINYIHCTFDEQRRNPSVHIQIDIYLVTNREFQSLLYIEMSNITRSLLFDHQARFYLHNYQQNFKHNFNISNIDNPSDSNTSPRYMIKLYKQINRVSSNTIIISSNVIIILFNCLLLSIFF